GAEGGAAREDPEMGAGAGAGQGVAFDLVQDRSLDVARGEAPPARDVDHLGTGGCERRDAIAGADPEGKPAAADLAAEAAHEALGIALVVAHDRGRRG